METADMPVPRRSTACFLPAAVALVAIVGCGSGDSTSPETLAGSYTATTFLVTPDGQAPVNVLSQGGSLTLTLASDKSVTGTLHLPASATGAEPLTVTMNGTVTMSGSTVEFQQAADTFVRDLTWSVGTNALSVTNQRAGASVFTITLTRQ
jgi:hypothetical protein